MLDRFRAHKTSIFTWVIFGGIIVFFVINFGPGSFTSGGCGEQMVFAAKVKNEGITISDFDFAYYSAFQMYRNQFGDRFDNKMAEQVQLRQHVLDQLIDEEILQLKAREYGFRVTDEELKAAIKAEPAFQANGKFDFQLYDRLVRYYYRTSPALYEEMKRKSLLADKMKDIVTSNIEVSDEELQKIYDLKSDRVNAVFVKFSEADYENEVKVKESDIEAVKKDEERIKKYYEDNKLLYDIPEKVHASHILFKLDPKASEADKGKARRKAQSVLERIRKGEDFSALAKEFSDDPGSKDKGGDLGFFPRGAMVKPFEEVAFSLKVGDVSEPVESPFGFHIIKVLEKADAIKKSLDDVREEIVKTLAKQDVAKVLLTAKGEEVLKKIREGQELSVLYPEPKEEGKDNKENKQVASAKPQLVAKETGFVSKGAADFVRGIGESPELFKDLFTLDENKKFLDKVYGVGGNYYVLQLKVREKPDAQGFEKEKDMLKKQYLASKSGRVLDEWLKSQREATGVWMNPEVLRYDAPARVQTPMRSRRGRR